MLMCVAVNEGNHVLPKRKFHVLRMGEGVFRILEALNAYQGLLPKKISSYPESKSECGRRTPVSAVW